MRNCGPPVQRKKKDADEKRAYNAPTPGQAVHVDLCFVPLNHRGQAKLPAVSGSSGHLVVETLPGSAEEKHWPGQIFAQLEFAEAMQSYAQQTRDRLLRQKMKPRLPEPAPTAWRKTWEARAERHAVLQQRRQEDADWRIERQAHHQIVVAYRALSRPQRAAVADPWQAQKTAWAQREQAHLDVLACRKGENQHWHQGIYQRLQKCHPPWLAILVVTDNCSRQCLGLPIFANGAKVTAGEVEQALRTLLPQELAFLISDQGTHFRAKALAQLALELDFIQIPIYRHRPQTNGIAERFVRSLKEWLRLKTWSGVLDLTDLLTDFRPEYNQRPHQGLPIPGLSPDEFANRIWLM
jgi:transposase InsO family protein